MLMQHKEFQVMHSDRCKNLAIISDISFFIPHTDFQIWQNVAKTFMKSHQKLYGTYNVYKVFRKSSLNLRGPIKVFLKITEYSNTLCMTLKVQDNLQVTLGLFCFHIFCKIIFLFQVGNLKPGTLLYIRCGPR